MASTARSPTKNVSTSSEFARRGLSRSENATVPITPPARYISSNFSTPGSTYGREEDAVILELSPRYIEAGIEGESHAQCRYEFIPDATRRVGDYRQHLPAFTKPGEPLVWETWGQGYELWRNDVKGLDLGLVGDKLERAVREIYNKNLLVDTGTAKLILVVPSLVPHPVLDTLLMTLFERWTFPSITLLPTTATTLIAAGLRSGLVVDIGWEETVITVMYEYREIKSYRSVRAAKMLSYRLAEWLKTMLPEQCRIDLETVETFWKRFAPHIGAAGLDTEDEIGQSRIDGQMDGEEHAGDNEQTLGEDQAKDTPQTREPRTMEVDAHDQFVYDWPTQTFTETVTFSKAQICRIWMQTLLGVSLENGPDDDEELPLHTLLYKALFHLPPDIRGICISRLVFLGDCSDLTHFPEMIMSALANLVRDNDWKEARGKPDRRLTEAGHVDAKHDDMIFSPKDITEERYLREKHKSNKPAIHNVIRRVETLGSWTGASLLSSLKVKSFVEVQREKFLSHGLAGATRDYEQSMSLQPKTNSLGLKKGDRISWTMAGFG